MEGFSKNNIEIKNQNEIELSNSSVSGQSEDYKKEIKTETPEEKEISINSKKGEILEIIDSKKENNIESKKTVRKGVDFVFEQNPELEKIGTKEQYSEYLDTIFPKSKIKDIVYHGSGNKNIEGFIPGKIDIGVHFGTLNAAKYRGEKLKSYKIYPNLLNIQKIKELPELNMWTPEIVFNYLLNEGLVRKEDEKDFNNLYNKNSENDYRNNGLDKMYEYLQNKLEADSIKYINNFEDKNSVSYIVFNPNNIYTLGSVKDVENFKKFTKNYQDSQGPV